jgi:hypothetical protein
VIDGLDLNHVGNRVRRFIDASSKIANHDSTPRDWRSAAARGCADAEGTNVNDSSPLPALMNDPVRWPRHHERATLETAPEWNIEASGEREADEPRSAFLRVCPEDAPRQAAQPLAAKALRAAVIANGAALVVLACVMQAVESTRPGLAGPVLVLAAGLVLAAVWAVAACRSWPKASSASWPARISGAGSYGALALAAVWPAPFAL